MDKLKLWLEVIKFFLEVVNLLFVLVTGAKGNKKNK